MKKMRELKEVAGIPFKKRIRYILDLEKVSKKNRLRFSNYACACRFSVGYCLKRLTD